MSFSPSREEFRKRLDEQHQWPAFYMFKFIVPKDNAKEVEALFPGKLTTSKHSKEGNYISITATLMMKSSDQVLDIYEKAYQIEGVISL